MTAATTFKTTTMTSSSNKKTSPKQPEQLCRSRHFLGPTAPGLLRLPLADAPGEDAVRARDERLRLPEGRRRRRRRPRQEEEQEEEEGGP